MTQNTIETSAEAVENAALPTAREVHCGPVQTPLTLPPALREPTAQKTAAQWAYERVINYIRNFEEGLDADHEVGLGMTGGMAGVVTIQGVGYFDPDILTFYGRTADGARTQLVQHVSQLNLMLVAAPRQASHPTAERIGFRLARALDRDVTT